MSDLPVPNGRAEIEALFGNPSMPDGALDPKWFAANIVLAKPLEPWELWYQKSETEIVRTTGVRLHRLVVPSWQEAMTELWAYAAVGSPGDNVTNARLLRWGFSITGGGFTYRAITGGKALSLHAYGIAEDRDPKRNPRRKPLTCNFPDIWFEIWAHHGWIDGRHFETPDPMHVQRATGA